MLYVFVSFFNGYTYFGDKPCSASNTTTFLCQFFLLPHSVGKAVKKINK